MFKNILNVYWLKLCTVPMMINSLFYNFITLKWDLLPINLFGVIFNIYTLCIAYPLTALINTYNVYKVKYTKSDREYIYFKRRVKNYYGNIKTNLRFQNKHLYHILNRR